MIKLKLILRGVRLLVRLYLRKKYGGRELGFKGLKYLMPEMDGDDEDRLGLIRDLFRRLRH